MITALRNFVRKPWHKEEAEHQVGDPVLTVVDLNVRYNSHPALSNVSFELRSGEQVAVVGPNGAGKSTLLKAVAGVLLPSQGAVAVYGDRPREHICIAYVPQRSAVDWDFPITVYDVVMMGRIGKLGLLRRPGKRDHQHVQACLDLVGITDLGERQISELSGGQQQRMFIARALAQQAALVLMDEPLAGLDIPAQEDIFKILKTLRQRDVTMMVSTHDLRQAAENFDRVMLLNQKILGFGPPEDVFTQERLMDAYGGYLRLLPSEGGLVALGDTTCEGGLDG